MWRAVRFCVKTFGNNGSSPRVVYSSISSLDLDHSDLENSTKSETNGEKETSETINFLSSCLAKLHLENVITSIQDGENLQIISKSKILTKWFELKENFEIIKTITNSSQVSKKATNDNKSITNTSNEASDILNKNKSKSFDKIKSEDALSDGSIKIIVNNDGKKVEAITSNLSKLPTSTQEYSPTEHSNDKKFNEYRETSPHALEKGDVKIQRDHDKILSTTTIIPKEKQELNPIKTSKIDNLTENVEIVQSIQSTSTKDKSINCHKHIRKLCRENKVDEALKLLDTENASTVEGQLYTENASTVEGQLYTENASTVEGQLDTTTYNALIYASAKEGYTNKAFYLYQKMIERHLKPKDVIYTSLFDGCSHLSDHNEGLDKAQSLRQQLKAKREDIPPATYHAMIKAFGSCGDMPTALEVVDDMVVAGKQVTDETVKYLLAGCISDKETGFSHAVMVWQKVHDMKLKPDVSSYNLLLNCASLCKADTTTSVINLTNDLGNTISNITPKVSQENGRYCKGKDIFNLPGNESQVLRLNISGQYKSSSPESVDCVITQSSFSQPVHRLTLLGGADGLLKQMQKDKVEPNLKTFIYLLNMLPSTREDEMELLQMMEDFSISPNTLFYNILVKRCIKRNKLGEAKEVLDLMSRHHHKLDISTFQIISNGCHRLQDTQQLLADMETHGIRPNLSIMTTMIENSLQHDQIYCAYELLREMKLQKIDPDLHLKSYLRKFHISLRNRITKLKDKRITPSDQMVLDSLNLFVLEYQSTLKAYDIKLKDQPWAHGSTKLQARIV